MTAPSFIHQAVTAAIAIWAFTSTVQTTEVLAVPRRVQIGPEIGLFSMYNGFLPYSQAGFKNDDFGYRYLRDGYFTYDWGEAIEWCEDSLNFNYQSLLQHYGQKLLLSPATQTLQSGEKVFPSMHWVAEQTKNKGHIPIYHDDFFGWQEDPAAEGDSAIRFMGSAAHWKDIVDDDYNGKVIEGYRWPGCFMISSETSFASNHDSLDGVNVKWAEPRSYFAFAVDMDDTVHFWFRMKRITFNHQGMNDPLVTVYIKQRPKLNSNDFAYIDTFSFSGQDFEDAGADNAYADLYHKSRAWVRKSSAGFKAGFAMRWEGYDRVALSHFAYAQERYMETNPDSGSAVHLNAFQEAFQDQIELIGHENMVGWISEESWRYGHHTFNELKEYLQGRLRFFRRVDEEPHHPVFMANEGGIGPSGWQEMINEAEPGALWIDGFPVTWKTTEATTADPDDPTGIQLSWTNIIEGLDSEDAPQYFPEIADRGWRSARQVAVQNGIPWYAGIQSSYELWKGSDSLWHLSSIGEPTERMVKCQGYLAMTFQPDGMFYSYFIPGYSKHTGPGPVYNKWYAEPAQSTKDSLESWRGDENFLAQFNGASHSGLMTFYPSANDSGEIMTAADLNNARIGNGVLRPNKKWLAAQEVNQYYRRYGPLINSLNWIGSIYGADEGLALLDGVSAGGCKTWDGDSWELTGDHVQLAVFREAARRNQYIRYFMLVNRRCKVEDSIKVLVTVSGDADIYGISELKPDGGWNAINALWEDPPKYYSFNVVLPPATGRLYIVTHQQYQLAGQIDDMIDIIGSYTVSGNVTVSNTGGLRLYPGSSLIYLPGSSLTVLGSFDAIGKADSTISFYPSSDDSSSFLSLQGTGTDTMMYCSFSHFSKGMSITKSGSVMTVIDHCEFSYNAQEGLYASGGEVKVTNSSFSHNGTDGAYLYNCKASLDSLEVSWNSRNGLYLYGVDAASTLKHSTFSINGKGSDSAPDANIRIYNCSPLLEKNEIVSGAEYGIYGVNGSYPVMTNSTTAANTIGDNANHESYWDMSWPSMDYGHNNLDVADDTLIYITATTPLSKLWARGNYWGGGAPNSGSGGSASYYGPGTLEYNPIDEEQQIRVRGDAGMADLRGLGKGGTGRIADAEEDAQELFKAAVQIEQEQPVRAMEAYRRIIQEFPNTDAAPMSLDRLMWLVRQRYDGQERLDRLDNLTRYFRLMADTSASRALRWKARRAALWALAAQRRYDEAIAGFEAIIARADNFADSIYAVIDAGTLHLEAQEWARRDSLDRVQSLFGSRHELAPADYPTHRRRTDELLALLNGNVSGGRALIPTEYFLDQNYPNPFNSVTRLQYGLPEATRVKVRIYDVMGREVAQLADGVQQAGYHMLLWEGLSSSGRPVASGVYFARIEAGTFVKTRKMTLVR